MVDRDRLTVGLAQIAPVWLDRAATLAKIEDWITRAAAVGCGFVAFGEALAPGYPFWIEHTDGARFDAPLQKDIHAYYLDQAVQVEAGHLDGVRATAARLGIAVMLGIIERPADRGGHSVYCSRVHIGADGHIGSVHRKLMPTYEERLSWAPGDGHGLRVHPVGPFTVGGLNCFENWMPLSRAALNAQGEDLHVALWPGNRRNTADTTRFLAREGRSYVLAVSGLMRREDVSPGSPAAAMLEGGCPDVLADGGSCIAGPDGEWVVEPVTGREELLVATLDHRAVRRERQNFDLGGHYARPDVTRLVVDRRRQSMATFEDGSPVAYPHHRPELSRARSQFHLAYNVRDLDDARRFYGGVLGCREGRSAPTWVDFDFFGHEISLHLGEPFRTERTGRVGDHLVPMPHLGVALALDDWKPLAERLRERGVAFALPPTVRFEGQPGEQWTMFFLDPSGNPIEIKGFPNLDALFQAA